MVREVEVMVELNVRSLWERAFLPILMFVTYAIVLIKTGLPLPQFLAFLFIFVVLAFLIQSAIVIDKRLEEGFERIDKTLKRGFKLEGASDPEEERKEEVKTTGAGALGGMMVGGLIGLIGGPIGVIIGGVIGAIVGDQIEYNQELERKKREREKKRFKV
jgi:hypothetical protein